MSASEYVGWIDFHKERQRQEEKQNGNLLAGNEDDLLRGLGL
jgi:hypothetical protein